MEVCAERAEEIGERKGAARRNKEQEDDEDVALAEEGQNFAIELREAFAGEAAVGSGRGNEEEEESGQDDACTEEHRGGHDGEMTDEQASGGNAEARSGDERDIEPCAELVFLVVRADVREPAGERGGGESGGGRDDDQCHGEQRDVLQIRDGDDDEDGGEKSEYGGVPAAAETDVEDGAEEDIPEIGGHGRCGDAGDGGFRDVTRREHLRHEEQDDARGKTVGGIAKTYEPDRRHRAARVHADLRGSFIVARFLAGGYGNERRGDVRVRCCTRGGLESFVLAAATHVTCEGTDIPQALKPPMILPAFRHD